MRGGSPSPRFPPIPSGRGLVGWRDPAHGLVKRAARRALLWVTHAIGKITGRNYFEDYVRVYPGGLALDRLGRPRAATPSDLKNYLNHRKFYQFAAQFVRGRAVADVGCGSGYGCEILSQAGAASVSGSDVSGPALRYATMRYGHLAEFVRQGITDLRAYRDASFDVTVSSEVLEHIKEYHLEAEAVAELKRITRPGGIVIVATPNTELLGEHGFSFEAIDHLFKTAFRHYCVFENALLPSGSGYESWVKRQAEGRTGVVVSEAIRLDETVLPDPAVAGLKVGIEPGDYDCAGTRIDTRLLHNTHSWVVVARE